MLRQLTLALGAWAVIGTTIAAAEDSVFSLRGLLMKGGNGKGKAKGKNKHKNKGPKCKNKHGKGCPKQTAHCPSYSATPHDDGTTTITVDYSCLKGGSIGYVVVDEGCDGHCDGNMKNVAGTKAKYTYKLGKDDCKDKVCIYAKDGQFEHAPGTDEEDVPSCAYGNKKHLCQICPYELEIIAEGAKCGDGDVCTGPSTCTASGMCKAGDPIKCPPAKPELCQKGDGVCKDGECKYEVPVHEQCAPGDGCTEPSTCTASGMCKAGDTIKCPPAKPELCQKGDGVCKDGECKYEEADDHTDCDVSYSMSASSGGCGGECMDGMCEPKTCAPECVNEKNASCENTPCCEGFLCNRQHLCKCGAEGNRCGGRRPCCGELECQYVAGKGDRCVHV